MVVTTNKPLIEWGKVLHDEDMAAAILDRVLERGRIIHLDGPYRTTRHLKLEGTLLPNTERVRISGTDALCSALSFHAAESDETEQRDSGIRGA